jgi:hypothetical protein
MDSVPTEGFLRALAELKLPPETLANVRSGLASGDHALLLGELPALHTAIKEAPEAQRKELLSSATTSELRRQQADLVMRTIICADTQDVDTLARVAAGRGNLQNLDRQGLAAMHRLAANMPADVKSEISPMIPEPARPLLSVASDMQTDEFIEAASGIVATMRHEQQEHGQQPLDAPGAVQLEGSGHHGQPIAAVPFGMWHTAVVVGKSQLRKQVDLLHSGLPELDTRALTLLAAALGASFSLLGALGHLLELAPFALTLSLGALLLSLLIIALEAEGDLAAAQLAAPILSRCPALRCAGGRAALCAAAGVTGVMSGGSGFSIACSPLLAAALLNVYAHHAAAAPLQRLRSELGSTTSAAAAFAAADVESSGSLAPGALSRLSAGLAAGNPAILRGATVALCPLGGHRTTQAGLAAWLSHADGGDQDGDVPPEAPTFYGATREQNTQVEGLGAGERPIDPSGIWELLQGGPPSGGWPAQPASSLAALAALAVALAALLALPAVAVHVIGELALVSSASAAVGSLAVDLSQLPPPIGSYARPLAVRLLRGCPPFSLVLCRGLALLLAAATVWQSASAWPSRLCALGGFGTALAAVVQDVTVTRTLLFGIAPPHLLSSPPPASTSGGGGGPQPDLEFGSAAGLTAEGGEQVQLQDAIMSAPLDKQDPSYLPCCVALDLDRDGRVGREDLRIFFGVRVPVQREA